MIYHRNCLGLFVNTHGKSERQYLQMGCTNRVKFLHSQWIVNGNLTHQVWSKTHAWRITCDLDVCFHARKRTRRESVVRFLKRNARRILCE